MKIKRNVWVLSADFGRLFFASVDELFWAAAQHRNSGFSHSLGVVQHLPNKSGHVRPPVFHHFVVQSVRGEFFLSFSFSFSTREVELGVENRITLHTEFYLHTECYLIVAEAEGVWEFPSLDSDFYLRFLSRLKGSRPGEFGDKNGGEVGMELLLRERVAVGKRIGGNQVFYRPNKSNLFQSGTEQREGLLSLVNSCHSFFHKARSLARSRPPTSFPAPRARA